MENKSDIDIVISDKEQLKKEKFFFFFFYLFFIFLLSNIIIVTNGSIFSFVHFLPNRKHYNEIGIVRNLRTSYDYIYIIHDIENYYMNVTKNNYIEYDNSNFTYNDDDDINDDTFYYENVRNYPTHNPKTTTNLQ